MPIPASASDEILEITAPSGLNSLGELIGMGNTGDIVASIDGSITCHGYSGYTLTIKSDKVGGYLESVSSPGTFLNQPLLVTSTLIKNDGGDVANNGHPNAQAVDTSGFEIGSGASSDNGTNNITLSVKQSRQAIATVPGTYKITLIWTVEAN